MVDSVFGWIREWKSVEIAFLTHYTSMSSEGSPSACIAVTLLGLSRSSSFANALWAVCWLFQLLAVILWVFRPVRQPRSDNLYHIEFNESYLDQI